jgi:probable HAF family extracellular repeat protein
MVGLVFFPMTLIGGAIGFVGRQSRGWISYNSQRYCCGRVWRWSAESGTRDIGVPAGDGNSFPRFISADGKVIVGISYGASGSYQTWRWTQESGIVGLGVLPGGNPALGDTPFTDVQGISTDGSVLVGFGDAGSPPVLRLGAGHKPQA